MRFKVKEGDQMREKQGAQSKKRRNLDGYRL
jgi:hypothetical protein